MKPNFSIRSEDPEIMDDLQCAGPVVERTLTELDFINNWLGGNAITLDAVAQMCRRHPQQQYHLVDVGCGSGDMLRRIARWSRKQGISMRLTGIDANPNIVASARIRCAGYPEITVETLDIFSSSFGSLKADIVTGTLFFHHFRDEQLRDFFRQMRSQVSCGVVINDLHRHPLAYHSIRILTRWFSGSAMVRFDAPLSVLRGFSRQEWLRILADSGWSKCQIHWKWAFRWRVILE